MKILFDHQIFSSQKYGGVSRYFIELLKQFDNVEQVEYVLDVKLSNNFYLLNNEKFHPCTFFQNLEFSGKNRLLECLNRYNTVRLLKQNEFDLFHPTFYKPYFLKYLNNKPFVLTVHDLIHEIYPQLPNASKEIFARKKLVEAASMIIAPSFNTKRDLLKFYDVAENKIKVIYHGSFGISDGHEVNVELPEKYFFFVGSRVFYKNFSLVLRAIAEIKKEYHDIHLICAGGGKFSTLEKNSIRNLNLESHVSQSNFSDVDLKSVYAKATAFVFPSLYEGFGIPVLEAFSNGCPCILAAASCLPEVAEDAALYFEPESVDDLSAKMLVLLSNKDLRQDLIEKGRDRNKHFSWEKTASETIDVYKKVLHVKETEKCL